MGLNGARVLVTGAGKGIGRAIATTLSERGAHVVALSRDPADLDALNQAIGCETVACDLSDLEATARAGERARPIDFLVNNAGVAELSPFLTTSVEVFDRIMTINATAAMVLSQIAARDMIERTRPGAIVNVSSTASKRGLADHAAYCASKAALDALTRVMAVELGGHGIRVNSVNPVITLTPMAVKVWSEPEKSEPMLRRVPRGRFVEPDEVARAVAFLLSEDAAMIHGHSLPVDGGFWAN